ncbi:hypothetical protein ACT3CE_16250 [Marinifilum sp. RC60d5]|uniref:hypothetical protein n=1 Tax=Marinifilum sp. RC60d5 TaxID=3458414 RepID=UPI0040359713
MDKSHFNTFILSSADKFYLYAYCIVKNADGAFQVVSDAIHLSYKDHKKMSLSNLNSVFKKVRDFSHSKIAQQSGKENNFDNPDNNLKTFFELTKGLSSVQMEVVSLRVFSRLNVDDISIIVGLGINSIQSILGNVRRLIRDRIGSVEDQFVDDYRLVKYYNGVSSIEDEDQLRLYFLRKEMVDCHNPDCELMRLIVEISQTEMPTEYFKILRETLKNIQKTSFLNRLFFKK